MPIRIEQEGEVVMKMGMWVVPALVAIAVPAQAAAPLSEAQVKAVIAKRSVAPLANFTFRRVQIAAPRAPSPGEIAAAGLPPGKPIVPVRVDYTEVTGGDLGRDHVQNYYFFQDDFGDWTAQPHSMPGNVTSDLHKVR